MRALEVKITSSREAGPTVFLLSLPRADRAILAITVFVLIVAVVAGCGSTGGDSQDEALESLRLTTEAASLQSEMGKLVGGLGGDPSRLSRPRPSAI